MCSARDVLLGIISIHEAGHTYKGRVENSSQTWLFLPYSERLLPIAVCSTQDALLGIVSFPSRSWTDLRGVENSG